MTIVCNVCGYDQNPNGTEFCDACGAELTVSESYTPPSPTLILDPVIDDTPSPEPTHIPIFPTTTTTARLIAKQTNAPIPEFPLDGSAVIGIFDSDSGPVDIDLENFIGNETISRNHAEIYPEAGVWKIKDLGSTNGVFIKPIGQTRFNARITAPTPLYSGDQIAIAKIIFLFQTP